jgi:MYXO-CTERM domain-containing protein
MLIYALLAAPPAFAGSVELRNDTCTDDVFSTDNSQVAWLAFPECAITVLHADASQLPLTVDSVYFLLGSSTGDQDGTGTLAEVGIQVTEEGATPSPGDPYEWGPEGVSVTVSSTEFMGVTLKDSYLGTDNVTMDKGQLVVWICAPDPYTGYEWPHDSSRSTSGLFIHNDSPDAGAYIDLGDSVQTLASVGAHGAWVIRATALGEGGDADTDTDSDSDTDSDTDADTGDLSLYAITPASTSEGTPVDFVLLGSGFVQGADVTIGGLSASDVTVQDSGTISGRSPSALPAGTHDVDVRNLDGTSASLTAAFTVDGKGGCGCTTGAGADAGWIVWVAPLAFALRRRRA